MLRSSMTGSLLFLRSLVALLCRDDIIGSISILLQKNTFFIKKSALKKLCYQYINNLRATAYIQCSGKHSNVGTIGFAIGFVLMMTLDVVIG